MTDIPVYSATGEFGKLSPLIREAHEVRTRAFHAIVEAGRVMNANDWESAKDCFAELISLAEDGYRVMQSQLGERPRGAYEG